MRNRYWMVIAPAMLAACHGPDGSTNQATSNMATVTDLQTTLKALPERSRNAVFQRAIRDADYECQFVREAKEHAPIRGRPAWAILCERDTPFIAVVARDNYLQIVPPTQIDTIAK